MNKQIAINLGVALTCLSVGAASAAELEDRPATPKTNRAAEEIERPRAGGKQSGSIVYPETFDTNAVTNIGVRITRPGSAANQVGGRPPGPPLRAGGNRDMSPTAKFAMARERMVSEQLAGPGRGLTKPKLLDAMTKVQRHNFVPYQALAEAYDDKPVNIGHDRSIEQPYVVAAAIDQLDLKPSDRVLELGTGSGYQAAVLSHLVKEVYTVESNEILAKRAEVDLKRQGYTNNVFVRHGEPSQGWAEAAPFDAIVVASGLEEVPTGLLNQLKEGGSIVIPVAQDGNMRHLKKATGNLVPIHSRPARPSR